MECWNMDNDNHTHIVTVVNSETRSTTVDINILLCAHFNITVQQATYPALISAVGTMLNL